MRRKAHGERFSLRGERRSLLGKTKLGGKTDSACAENGKVCPGKGETWVKNGKTRARQAKLHPLSFCHF